MYASTLRIVSACTIARLSGKNWYTEPIATPARSASRVVVRPSYPTSSTSLGAGVEHPAAPGPDCAPAPAPGATGPAGAGLGLRHHHLPTVTTHPPRAHTPTTVTIILPYRERAGC